MKKQPFAVGWALVVALLAIAACTDESPRARSRPSATPSPTGSPGDAGVCRPFPDRLIDRFLAAYNVRDLDALNELVVAPAVEDLVASAYGGESSFAGAEGWARAAWSAGDRMTNAGYSIQPSKSEFQMLVTRTSDDLADAGIESVSVALEAAADGCTITSLATAGPVQAMEQPCAFYESFRKVADVARAEPRECADGSARFARSDPVVAAAGGSGLVWGGARGGYFRHRDVAMDGLLIDAGSSRASRIRPPSLPEFAPEAHAWTGTELVVLGTKIRPDHHVVAASYSPADGSWTRLPFPFDHPGGFEAIWTGREVLLWGGPVHSERPARRGLAYDPLTRVWRKTAPAPEGGRWYHAVVWTGTEMIVFGGGDAETNSATGLAYHPATDAWRKIAPSPLSPRQWLPLVWTGEEVLAWGGSSISRSVADGAAYDPVDDTWRKLPRSPLRGRHYHSAVWTGSEAIVFGGYDYRRSFADGAAYDPAADRWRRLPTAPTRPRFGHGAAWTGSEMLVFGGTWDFGHLSLGDGAWYDPARNRWRRIVPRVQG